MAVITKPHTFYPNTDAMSSEVNSDFDTIYNEFNGNINSANVVSTFSWPASQISINATGGMFTSINVNDAVNEMFRGYHTIHTEFYGSHGVVLMPGDIEVGLKRCTIALAISVTSLPDRYDSGSTLNGRCYLVVGPNNAGNITASDVFIVKASSVVTTAGMNFSQGGFYYNNKRVVASVYYNVAGLFWQGFNPDMPKNNYVKQLDATGASGMGFSAVQYVGRTGTGTYGSLGSGTGTWWQSIMMYADRDMGGYGFMGTIRFNTATAITNLFGVNLREFEFIPHLRTDVTATTISGYAEMQFGIYPSITYPRLSIQVQISSAGDRYGAVTLSPFIVAGGNI